MFPTNGIRTILLTTNTERTKWFLNIFAVWKELTRFWVGVKSEPGAIELGPAPIKTFQFVVGRDNLNVLAKCAFSLHKTFQVNFQGIVGIDKQKNGRKKINVELHFWCLIAWTRWLKWSRFLFKFYQIALHNKVSETWESVNINLKPIITILLNKIKTKIISLDLKVIDWSEKVQWIKMEVFKEQTNLCFHFQCFYFSYLL